MRFSLTIAAMKTCFVGYLLLALLPNANAVPSFARQTGQACVACHVSFPELTPYGRYFKLTGYTIGERKWFPIAMMAQANYTSIKNNDDGTGTNTPVINNRESNAMFSGASVFVAGKATDYLGGFIQWTFNNAAPSTDANGVTSLKSHSQIDNTDVRLVGKYAGAGAQEPELIYGLTVHNNPTVQDVWNSTAAFGFPYTTSPLSGYPTPARTQVDNALGQQVAGLGGYVFLKKSLYAELSFYRTADGAFSLLRGGLDTASAGGVARLQGYNPYLRLAWNHEWGPNSVMVGGYGLRVDRFPDNTIPGTPTDRYTDYAVDAQYQYISDVHTYTAQAAYIWEKQDYRASFPAGGIGAGPVPVNATDNLQTFKVKGTYYYQRKYGATLAYFNTTGSIDTGLFAPTAVTGSANGSPNSTGYIMELNYVPVPNVRLMLQYTGYTKFNGGNTGYDGLTARSARDNNLLFANVWVAF